jgi:chaperonin GroES
MIYDRILVRVIPAEGKTKGGLFVPASVHENAHQWRGEVLAVGRGRQSEISAEWVKPQVKAGDVITFIRAPQSGEQAVLSIDLGDGQGDEELLVIREAHILCVLTELPRATGLRGVDGKELLVQ